MSLDHGGHLTHGAKVNFSGRNYKSVQYGLHPETHDIKDFNVEEGYKNFAVLIFSFYSLEFLYLKSSGHRRSIHDWQDDYKASWLVP